MGFEHWEVGFRKKMGWEMGLVPPPPSGPSYLQFTAFLYNADPDTKIQLSLAAVCPSGPYKYSMFVVLSTATCSRHYIVTENYTLVGGT